MQKYDDIQSEIQAIEDELTNLNNERIELKNFPTTSSDSVRDIVATAKNAAALLTERKPLIEGIEDAIASLENQLRDKRETLQNLESVHQEDLRRERLDEAKVKAQKLGDKLSELGTQIEATLFELRALAVEYGADVRNFHKNYSLDFVDVNRVSVPTLTTNSYGFKIESRMIDLFKSEREIKEVERQKELEKARKIASEKRLFDESRKLSESRHKEKYATELRRQDLQSQIDSKAKELEFVEQQKSAKERNQVRDSLKNMSTPGFQKFTYATNTLQSEIDAIQSEIDNLPNSD